MGRPIVDQGQARLPDRGLRAVDVQTRDPAGDAVRVLDGKKVAAEIRAEIATQVARFVASARPAPKLVAVLVTTKRDREAARSPRDTSNPPSPVKSDDCWII